MQNKKLSFLMILVVAFLAGISAVYASQDAEKTAQQAQKQTLIQARPPATMGKLGELDSKIELLKKQLKIKKLESEIKEAEAKQNQRGSPELENRFKQLQFPEPPQKETGKESVVREERRQQPGVEKDEFEDFISQARVVSVNGFGKKLQAKIKLPEGGSMTVERGPDYGRLGTVKSISRNNIVLRKSGKEYFVPFSDMFKGKDSDSDCEDCGDGLNFPPDLTN